LVLLLFWFTLAVVYRGKIVNLEHSYRLTYKAGDTAPADQLEAELRAIRTSRRRSGRGSGR
jgi:hypothetical protein